MYEHEIEKLSLNKKEYLKELTENKAILSVNEAEIKSLEESLEICEKEHSEVVLNDQALVSGITRTERGISTCQRTISEKENNRIELQKELDRVFFLSFGKKGEIKNRIEELEEKIGEEKSRLNELYKKKKAIESQRNLIALGASEERIKQIKSRILMIEEGNEKLKSSIASSEKAIKCIEEEILELEIEKTKTVEIEENEKKDVAKKITVLLEGMSKRVIGSFVNVIQDYATRKAIEEQKMSQNIVKELTEFEEMKEHNSNEDVYLKKKLEIFRYEMPGIKATGYQLEDGRFVVKKGSKVCMQEKITCSAVIKKLRKEHAMVVGKNGVLKEDITFTSANQATNFCYYGASIATIRWVTRTGMTLGEYRKINHVAEEKEKKQIVIEEKSETKETKNYDNSEIEVVEISNTKKNNQIEEHHIKSNASNTDNAYSDIYGLAPEDYVSVSVDTLGFSVRLCGRLLSNGYGTVEKLLKTNDDTLREIRGFGKGCFDELHAYFKSLVESSSRENKTTKSLGLTTELLPYKDKILHGDFSFIDAMKLEEDSMIILQQFKEAHSIFDYAMVEEIINGSPEIFKVFVMLKDYENRINSKKECEKVICSILKERRTLKVKWMIRCFTDDSSKIEELQEGMLDNEQTLEEYLYKNAELIGNRNSLLMSFVEWCQFDIKEDIHHFFREVVKADRELFVIRERASGKTLEAVGKQINVTRERIRQIEKRTVRKFASWQKHSRIIYKLFIEMKEELSLSSMELIDYLGEYGQVFVYLMKSCEADDVIYDKQLDMFIIDDSSIGEKVQSYVESMPESFNESKLQDYINSAVEEYEYPEKMFMLAFEEQYNKTGDMYHRSRLTLSGIYSDILDRFYPNGIHVYDEKEIEHFRHRVQKEYGIDISSKSDHAIGSVLSRISILCGRGIYKLRQEKSYMSKSLAKKIYDYIEKSEHPVFMTNTLFCVFEDELLEEGIDNKYYMQGILRDLYEDKWTFRRDYISKDESYTSVYSSIIGFIKSSKYPVTKDDIIRTFPGVTDIVINLAIADTNIINLFGKYIHSSRLKLSENDIQYLRSIIEEALDSKEVCNCHDLYDYIYKDNPALLKNNYVEFTFSLQSILEYLFSNYYNFSRPFIARENAEIEKGVDVLKEIVEEAECIEVAEIQTFIREHRVRINSIRDFIDSCNDTHIFINNLEVASIEYAGVSEDIANEIENSILAEIQGTTPIQELCCIHSLPSIKVKWNAWLIYSILKKWGKRLEVGVSDVQFRYAYPLVSPIGKMELDNLAEISSYHEGKLSVADDLNNIDDLIEDFVSFELEDLDEF